MKFATLVLFTTAGNVYGVSSLDRLVRARSVGAHVTKTTNAELNPECADLHINGEEEWHDNGGPTYNCLWYSQWHYCSTYGHLEQYANGGYTAGQACCVCGGGREKVPDGPSCSDITPNGQKWHDADPSGFYNCAWYAQGHHCEQYGNEYANDGYTAKEACCACGGGGVPTPSPTSSPPTPSPTASPKMSCGDIFMDGNEKWHDNGGKTYDCLWYAKYDRCEQYGQGYANGGFTASQACCSCGGGLVKVPEGPTCADISVNGQAWHDADPAGSYNCAWYGQGHHCEQWGHLSQYANWGYTAKQACCVCGGGHPP